MNVKWDLTLCFWALCPWSFLFLLGFLPKIQLGCLCTKNSNCGKTESCFNFCFPNEEKLIFPGGMNPAVLIKYSEGKVSVENVM